jgi:hypothetical protein
MFSWRRLGIKTRRRYVMITSVLKLWAHNLQSREFEQWRAYKTMKKERRFARENALKVYGQRCVRLSLTGFILAAQHVPAVEESGSDDELLSSSAVLFEETVPVKLPKMVEPKGLAAPKRPAFLGPTKARPAPPGAAEMREVAKAIEVNPETLFATLESRYEELKTRLELEDGEQKEQTLAELDSLMDEIRILASGLSRD